MGKSQLIPSNEAFGLTSKLLQITFSVDEYEELIQKYRQTRKRLHAGVEIDTYWHILPIYSIARCPFCDSQYLSSADTHSLFKWVISVEGRIKTIFSEQYQTIGCPHFVTVQQFLNLNGLIPSEEKVVWNQCGDIPIVTPELFFDDLRTYAVIHSLPICRIEKRKFVPRYSVYTITYYSEEPQKVYNLAIDRKCPPEVVKQQMSLNDGHSPCYLFSSSARARLKPQVADLRSWLEQKRLYWLDLRDPALPLTNDLTAFPYQNIQGFGEPFIYRKRPEPRWWWQKKNWHPDGEIWNLDGTQILARPD